MSKEYATRLGSFREGIELRGDIGDEFCYHSDGALNLAVRLATYLPGYA